MKSVFLLFTLIWSMVMAPAAALAADTNLKTNRVNIGQKNTQNKEIIFDMNAGAANPRVRANGTTGKLQFSNDGTVYKDIGSGGGGGGGVDLMENGDAEAGTTGFTASGGTYAVTTTAANVGEKLQSFSWDAALAAQTLTSSTYTITAGLAGGVCGASFIYKGGDSNLTATVVDGSGNILASLPLVARTTYNDPSSPTVIGFACPSQGGTVKLVFTAAADAAVIYLDLVKIGSLPMFYVADSLKYGSLQYPVTSGCNWTTSTNAYGTYSADSDCPVASVAGRVSAPATKIPAAVLANAPPGEYTYFISANHAHPATSNFSFSFKSFITTGTVTGHRAQEITKLFNSATSPNSPFVLMGSFTNATTQNIQIEVQGKSGSGSLELRVDSGDFNIEIFRSPPAAEAALRIGTEAMIVDANLVAAANVDLGTSNVSSYAEITDSALSLTNNTAKSTVAAQIACASGTASTGTTCSSAESVGIAFEISRAGIYQVCADFSHKINVASTTGDATVGFQLVETTNTSSAIVQEGGGRLNSRKLASTAASSPDGTIYPVPLCGTFRFDSVGKKTIRLMREQNIVATVNQNALQIAGDALTGQPDMHWTVVPIGQTSTQPIIMGPFYQTIDAAITASTYSIPTSLEEINFDTTSNAITATLPLGSAALKGKKFILRKITTDGNFVTIATSGSQFIGYNSSITSTVIHKQGETIALLWDGSRWQWTDGSDGWRTEVGELGGTCVVGYESGNWLGAVSNPATGDCDNTINTGIFSSRPICQVVAVEGLPSRNCNLGTSSSSSAPTATSIKTVCQAVGTNTGIAITKQIVCQGPR